MSWRSSITPTRHPLLPPIGAVGVKPELPLDELADDMVMIGYPHDHGHAVKTNAFFTALERCERILVAGAGGGFDVDAGLPLALGSSHRCDTATRRELTPRRD